MKRLIPALLAMIAGGMWLWYRREKILEGEGTVRLLATYRLPPAPTTDAGRWKGLAGFPNYPGPGWNKDTSLNEQVLSA